ncbi:MAG TPA: zinc-dependent alcohol dehydrogenase [Candidatus Eremiobacteraceae bacterium]|nr:zinc-dependent alcohol dehydrogenase [Candidatus Eremiobacteraceae bacterium]
MKAAVLCDFKTPLSVQNVDVPKPGEGEVLIKVEVCGVCHSDLHVADGDWAQFARIVKKPLILGHEIVGTIVETDSAGHDLKVGERVGVPWVHWTCGQCDYCLEGNENLCARQGITGVTVDGGYAEFVKAPATHVVRIPADLSSEQAAPLLCAGVTGYRALKQSGLGAGERLAVFGVGGLGHIAVQIGREFGADVTAIDINEEKLALAKSLGAARTLNAASENVVKQLRAAGGVHVALVTSAAKAAYDTAFPCVRPSGTLLVVGLPAQDISFPPIMMAASEIRIQASAVGTRRELQEVLALGAAGKVRCEVATRPLSQANEVLEQLRRGQIAGRVVLRVST